MASRVTRCGLCMLVLLGCSRGGVESVGPSTMHDTAADRVVITRPHWDQVCRSDTASMLIWATEEVVETERILPELRALLQSYTQGAFDADRSDRPFVDVAVSYEASGTLRTAHLAVYNVKEDVARGVARAVGEAVHPRVRAIAPVRVRVRVALGMDEIRLDLVPALRCMPHIAHDDDPPRFLGDARVMGGRLGPGLPLDHGPRISVRIIVSERGVIERIHVLGGNRDLLDRVRETLSSVEIDPALLNGEPVRGHLDLTFRFPERDSTPRTKEGGCDPLKHFPEA